MKTRGILGVRKPNDRRLLYVFFLHLNVLELKTKSRTATVLNESDKIENSF